MIAQETTARLSSAQWRAVQILIALALLLLALLLFWGGLQGAFVQDDTPNLYVIAQLPSDPQWRDFWYLANTGSAGVLGRPLSLLSFLLQHQSWPDPYQFKLVNLLLHTMNAMLLGLLCLVLRKQVRAEIQPLFTFPAIMIAMFVWMSHPLQVSTVLYVVQRMTSLSAFFILLGIYLYLAGRADLRHQHKVSALLKMVAGIIPCGLLAVFSKESGVLLLPYIAVLELTLLTSVPHSSGFRKTRVLLVYLPLLLGFLAFLAYLPIAMEGYELKPFTASERVLAQFPVLITYLASIALLIPNYFGVFHDDFPVVSGLFTPWYFLPSAALVTAALACAVFRRKQWPLFSFALLWFLAGHALESTLLPLELYFEHRNYLPLFGPVLALVLKLQQFNSQLNSQLQPVHLRHTLRASAGLWVVWMCVLTWQQSHYWGNPLEFARQSVSAHPRSVSARANLVETLSRSGRIQEAFALHLESIDPQQADIAPYVRWLEFRCLIPASELPDRSVLENQALNAPHDYGAIFQLNDLTFGIVDGQCRQAPLQELETVLANLLLNPAFAVSAPDLLQMQGFIAASRNEYAAAAELAAASFARKEDVRVGLYRTSWLVRAGLAEQASYELQLLLNAYADSIAASADLTARVQFLQQELGLSVQ